MNKNKKLYNQSTNEQKMEVNFSLLYDNEGGFYFQSNMQMLSNGVRDFLSQYDIIPRYFEYVVNANIIPKLNKPNLSQYQFFGFKIKDKTIPLVCSSPIRIGQDLLFPKTMNFWFTIDEWLKLEGKDLDEYLCYMLTTFSQDMNSFLNNV